VKKTGVKAAIDAAGGFRPLAVALGIDHRAVMRWNKIPTKRLLDIEKKVDVPRHELRPDIFKGYVLIDEAHLPRPSKRLTHEPA